MKIEIKIQMIDSPMPSSSVKKIGYDETSRELFVQFVNGTYKYMDVMPDVWEKLLKAPSIGKFVSKDLIPNHACKKVKIENEIIK